MHKLYPLTHPQKRIWYVEKTFPKTGVSNISATVRIKEHINFACLEKAINHVVKINDAMRTRITEKGVTPMQYYEPYRHFKLDFFDFSDQSIDDLYQWDTALSRQPIKFIDSQLFYFAMFKLNDSDGGYYCNLHHIITDAWTEMLLNSQVMIAYRAFCESREPDISPAPSYTEYITREEKYLTSDKLNNDREYWTKQFTPVTDLVTLQTKKRSKKNLIARRKTFLLSRKEAEVIRNFCKDKGITVFSFFLTMLTIYINRITGSNDIVLGTPVLNRLNAREKSIFGMFISTVPLRFSIDESAKYLDYARSITTGWLSILRHQQYPYDLLQQEIRKNNSEVENLYEITLSYQNAKTAKDILLWDGSTRWHFSGYQNDPLVIHINDRDDNGTLIINYDYNISCFADREIEFIHSHFKSLIDDAIENPDKPIYSLSMISSEELKRIQSFSNTADDYDRTLTYIDLFQKQVALTPEAEALVFHDQSLTFARLDAAANRIANYLRSKGIQRDDIVAVMLPRGFEIVSSMLGVMIAGGAFLPIDPAYPEERIKYMIENSCTKYVITTNDLAARFSLESVIVIYPDNKEIARVSPERPILVNKPDDLIYIIYTSGSTGLPKGVMIKHSGLCSFIQSLQKIMYFQSGEAVLSLSTIAFDLFILEVFPALVNGMKVVITDEKEQIIPSLQKDLIIKHRITKLLNTPMRMQLLLDDPGNRDCFLHLKEIMIGADIFSDKLLKQIKEVSGAQILNAYGPTEITIATTFKNLTNVNEINIGRPINGSKMYILDKHMNMVPIGVPGEIYIGGNGLARGYLNNPELTAEKYILSPFSPGERLYRTGDLGRWYPKGEIAFLGRIDSQVKIRGLRIELGEIENVIRQFPDISDVVVLDIEEQGKKFLCAYILPENGLNLDFKMIRNKLLKKLPGFMVPSFYIMIDSIPLNSSGKTDKRALPKPDKSHMIRRNYIPPKGPYETKLASIWKTVLDIKKIGSDEDFFDLGGDSLDVVNLVTAVHTEFGVEMAISDIYDTPVLREQAVKIRELSAPVRILENPNIVPLQRGKSGKNLFLIHAGNGEVSNYYQLCRILSDSTNYYGIRYLSDSITPLNLTISEIALSYLKQIQNIQPHGPYLLAGWCIGGTIAFEMSRQLEEKGKEVALLTIINSICPQNWEGIQQFDINSERAFISSFMTNPGNDTIESATNINALWNVAINDTSGNFSTQNIQANIPKEVSAVIPNFCTAEKTTLISYINIIRTLHNARATYYPTNNLNTNVCFIEANASEVIIDKDANLKGWQRYCFLPIQRIPIDGDHFSIFVPPYVNTLGQVLNSLILNY